jgi:hypothetical protein
LIRKTKRCRDFESHGEGKEELFMRNIGRYQKPLEEKEKEYLNKRNKKGMNWCQASHSEGRCEHRRRDKYEEGHYNRMGDHRSHRRHHPGQMHEELSHQRHDRNYSRMRFGETRPEEFANDRKNSEHGYNHDGRTPRRVRSTRSLLHEKRYLERRLCVIQGRLHRRFAAHKQMRRSTS